MAHLLLGFDVQNGLHGKENSAVSAFMQTLAACWLGQREQRDAVLCGQSRHESVAGSAPSEIVFGSAVEDTHSPA